MSKIKNLLNNLKKNKKKIVQHNVYFLADLVPFIDISLAHRESLPLFGVFRRLKTHLFDLKVMISCPWTNTTDNDIWYWFNDTDISIGLIWILKTYRYRFDINLYRYCYNKWLPYWYRYDHIGQFLPWTHQKAHEYLCLHKSH